MMNFNILDPNRPMTGGPLSPIASMGGGGGVQPGIGTAPMAQPQGGAGQPGTPPLGGFLQMLQGLAGQGGPLGQVQGAGGPLGFISSLGAGLAGQGGQNIPKAPSLIAQWMLRGGGAGPR